MALPEIPNATQSESDTNVHFRTAGDTPIRVAWLCTAAEQRGIRPLGTSGKPVRTKPGHIMAWALQIGLAALEAELGHPQTPVTKP